MVLALEQKEERHKFVRVTRCESKNQQLQDEADNEIDGATAIAIDTMVVGQSSRDSEKKASSTREISW